MSEIPDRTVDAHTEQRQAQRRLIGEALTCERPAIIKIGLQSLITALSIVGYTVALAHIVADLAGYPTDLHLKELLLVLAVSVAARISIVGWMETTARELGIRCKGRYQRELLRFWFDRPSYTGANGAGLGSELRLFDDGMTRIAVFYQRFLPASIQLAILPPVIGLAAILIDWPTGLILLATGPLIPIFMVLIGWTTVWQTRRQWAALQALGQTFFELLRGGVALRALGCEQWVMGIITGASETFRQRTMKVLAVAFLSALVLELLAMLGLALVAVQAGIRLVEGMLAFAPALAVLLLAPEFYLPFRNLGSRHHAGMEGAESAVPMFKALSQARTQSAVPQPPSPAVTKEADGLLLSGLCYTYPSQPQRPAVRDFSVHLAEGSITAIAGPSGAGKTTVARLILGLLDPTQGTIHWRGRSRDDFTVEEWQSLLAWVPQMPAFFPGSLRDNLVPASRQPDDRQIDAVLKAVQMSAKVKNLPAGLSTPVAEAALTLSVGERQRLAIARALLRNARILILDEPTASLDPANEQALLELLQSLVPATTILIIAHRPATLKVAERIIQLAKPE